MVIIKRLTVFVLLMLVCAGLAVLVWQKWQQRPPVGVPVIEVTPEISLQPLAVLTSFNREYSYTPTPLRQKLSKTGIWNYISHGTAAKWLTWLKPGIGWTERYSGEPHGITIVYGFKYPAEWDTTRIFEDVSDALRLALDNAHMEFSAVSYGEQWITNGMPVEFNAGFPNDDPKQRRVTVTVLRVPVYLPEVKFGLIHWPPDNKDNPARLYTLENPLYQPVVPVAQPVDALPVTRTDGGADKLEVTMRAFVSGTFEADLKSRQRVSVDKQISNVFSSLVSAASGDKSKPDRHFPDDRIAESGVIPASLFPVENREHKKKSVAVIEIKQPGEKTPEWDLDLCLVTYGEQKFPFWYNRNARGNDRQIFIYMTGDLSVLPQPLAVTVQLKRTRNFPPDEEQTVEFPLPKRGSKVALDHTLKFWQESFYLDMLICGAGPITDGQLPANAPTLSLAYKTDTMGYAEDSVMRLQLIGSNGINVEPKLISSSSISSPQSNMFNYYSLRLTEANRLYDYDSFTTASITVRRPRPDRRNFQFIVSPEKATGPSVE